RRGDDLLNAWTKRVEVAGLGETTLGKDADDLARLERAAHLLERALLQAWILARRRDGYGPHRPEQPGQHGDAKDAMVHHEPYGASHARRDDHRVDVSHMVAHEHARAFLGHVLQPFGARPVDRVHEEPREEAHEEL